MLCPGVTLLEPGHEGERPKYNSNHPDRRGLSNLPSRDLFHIPMKYEFHLTAGNPRLVRTLNYGIETFEAGTPILAIESIDKDGLGIATDWMTAQKASLNGGHIAALRYLFNSQNKLGWYYGTTNEPYRKKIEVEYRTDCVPEEYLYIETHFQVSAEEAKELKTGISRNLFSGTLIATERCYESGNFHEFAQRHAALGRKVELCLLDTNVQHDAEGQWMKVPKKIGTMSEASRKTLSDEYGKVSRSRKLWEVS